MTCECGAFKTYKAAPKSTLHSDWCNQSPVYKPPKAKVINAKDVVFTFNGFPMGVQNVLYGAPNAGKLPFPPGITASINIPCDGCPAKNFATVKIDYPVDQRWVKLSGSTMYFCDKCSNPTTRYHLVNGGCTVTTL